MNRIRRMLRLVLAGVIGLVALAPGTAAYADAPQREVWPFEFTYTYADQCAFPVEFNVNVEFRVTTFTDSEGNIVKVQYNGVGRPTFTNTQNGNTLEGLWSAPQSQSYPDSSGTIQLTAQGHMSFTAPHGGRIQSTTGRVVLRYTAGDPEPEVIFEAGRPDGGWTVPSEDITALCPYLE